MNKDLIFIEGNKVNTVISVTDIFNNLIKQAVSNQDKKFIIDTIEATKYKLNQIVYSIIIDMVEIK